MSPPFQITADVEAQPEEQRSPQQREEEAIPHSETFPFRKECRQRSTN